jgi:hypothetical protein
MKPAEPIEILKAFCEMQKALWAGFVSLLGGKVPPYFIGVPRTGKLECDGRRWEFTTHGTGVLFVEEGGKWRVDLHDGGNGVDQLDSWRLATFFSGLGREGEKVVTRASGRSHGTMEERVQTWLARLAEEGVLIAEGSAFRLSK